MAGKHGLEDEEAWRAAGLLLARRRAELRGRGSQQMWEVGDWLVAGEERVFRRMKRLKVREHAAVLSGYSMHTLKMAVSVARRVSPEVRVDGLTWWHHLQVAWLGPHEQAAWLTLAAETDWSVSQLRERLREAGLVGSAPSRSRRRSPDSLTGVLQVRGTELVDPDGRAVRLCGVGLGGWMNMENFITGHSGTEEQLRTGLRAVLGDELYERFFDRFLEAFFGPADARYLASLRLNLVRLPINYRHFEDDLRPFEIDERGFRHLDRAIELCAGEGIYTIIDLHALPGCQNQDWHSDNPTHRALFWSHRHFQDRAEHLWRAIARRYRGHPWVAGYNPINEPADENGERMVEVCGRLLAAIRAEDPDHVVFMDGNRYSREFDQFGEPWPNVVYTLHDYAAPGSFDGSPYPGIHRGEHFDGEVLERKFVAATRYMRETGTPVWVGEFGPVYRGDHERDEPRYRLLQDQLDIYERHRASWAIWTYKDIGLQGLVHTDPASPWMRRLRPHLDRKARLGVDAWGSNDEGIRDVMGPLEDLVEREAPDFAPYPHGRRSLARRLVRHVLLAEAMAQDFPRHFEDLTEAEVDELADSFRFDRCIQREPLSEILRRPS